MDGRGPATDRATSSSERERRLDLYVAALAGIAVLVPLAVLVLAPPATAAAGWPLALALGVGVVATELFAVQIRIGPTLQSTTVVELAAIPVVLLFEPTTAIAVGIASGLVAELLHGQREARKFVFNLSWHVTGIALASLAFTVLRGGAPFDDSAGSIAAALVAGAVFVGWNLTTFAGLVAILTGRRLWSVLKEESLSPIVMNGGTAAVGLLVALLLLDAPAALPVLVLLALLIHMQQRDQSHAQERLATELDRFERTLAGSSDGAVLLDATGVVEVWNPAMAALTGIDEARAVGAGLDELGWSRLLDVPAGTDDDLRLQLAGRVLAVRRAAVPGTRPGRASTVLTVRDVSREAELARIREDLVMRISHELRTPLTSLEGFLEVLARHWGELGDGGRQELVQAAQRGSRRLSRLVSNLMVWAGIESRSDDPRRAGPVDVPVVLGEVLGEVELAATDVHVDAGEATTVAVDHDDVRTILTNLLSNATLYGADPIELALRRRGEHVELAVTDGGPGPPATFRHQLFEPFSQASDGLQRTAKGLGLGLAIVRAIAVAHGGDVRYDDVPDGGARFTVTLPAAEHHTVVLPEESGSVATSGTSSSSR